MNKKLALLAALVVVVMISYSCVYHEIPLEEGVNTDESLFNEINGAGYGYYQAGSILAPASASPHGTFRLRFNEVALSALDASGELPNGGSFPAGAVIVKEVYSGNAVNIYAVMKKAPSDIYAGNGWLWAEYKTDGTPAISLKGKGEACVYCHRESSNRDLTRTFDLH